MHEPQPETLRTEAAAVADGAHPLHIAGYRILGLLGEGGMGRVYHARELHPPRDVALKLVRALDGNALARFRREAELLATLEHPNIARLYAAGDADFGGVRLPWLALEYVRGTDLVSYARRQALGLRERIALLIAICRAVHHAHGRGVIHRDLKPGNILVDEQGQARVLDFGIARLRDEGEGMTEAGQVLGTVPYMSPEQLAGRSREVDARSDVYALGVIGYELVAARLPYPRLSTSTVFEALDIVRRETPPRLATLAPSARGDLDVVVMKALASEPERRYSSAAEFAADLERVLDHRPVEARPPSVGYLAARFVRRHRGLSAAALAIALVLVVATAVSLRYAVAAREALAEARLRTAETEAVNRFLDRMLTAADPSESLGEKLTVAELLDRAERELAQDRAPAGVRLSVLATLAATRAGLGQFEAALALNDQALALADGAAQAPVALRAQLRRQQASLLTELARYDAAREAVASARALPSGVPPAERLRLDLTAARLAEESGRGSEAETGYRAVIAAAPGLAVAGDADAATLRDEALDLARSNLSGILREQGALDEAQSLGEAVLAQRLALFGERDPRTLASRHKLSLTLAARGEQVAAERESRAALALQREVLGDDHASTLTSIQTLANALLAQGKLDEAEALTREALAGWEGQFGEAHAQTVASMNALAYLLEERKQVAEAEALYRRIISVAAQQGSAAGATLAPRNNLAMLLATAGRHADARREFETLLAEAEATVGRNHPFHAIFSSNYGWSLLESGDRAEAVRVLTDAHQRLETLLGAEHARTRTAGERLARASGGD